MRRSDSDFSSLFDVPKGRENGYSGEVEGFFFPLGVPRYSAKAFFRVCSPSPFVGLGRAGGAIMRGPKGGSNADGRLTGGY